MSHHLKMSYAASAIFFISLMLPMPVGANTSTAFYFGNHIDTHQETVLKQKNGEPRRLRGDFLIIYTGEVDEASGLPIARHPKGASEGEACGVEIDCDVGWKIKAVPGEAKFLFHSGVNGKDHPVWMVNRVQIPQPGSYAHFHWITSLSNDPRADVVPLVCEADKAGDLEGAAEDTICPGWFMQITAVQSFAFQHGNEIIPVRPGKDNATHLNLLTNYPEGLGITPIPSE